MRKAYTKPELELLNLTPAEFILASSDVPDEDFGGNTSGSVGGEDVGGIF